MAIENNDIVRITCKFSYQNNDVQNVYHMKVSVSATTDEATFLSEVAADMDSMHDDIVSLIANDVSFDSVEIYNVTDQSYVGEIAFPSKTAGTATTDVLPPQVSALCLFGTNVLRSQGRKFLPPMTETVSDTFGVLTSTAITAIAGYVADCLLEKSGNTWTGVLGNWNDSLQRFAEWTSGVVNDAFATQRRRYLGRGS